MSDRSERRVVITGLGALTPLGLDVESTWEGLIEGRSGIGPVTAFDASEFEQPIAGELKGFEPERYVDAKLLRRIDRSSVLAMAASKQAVHDAQLDLERQQPRQRRDRARHGHRRRVHADREPARHERARPAPR